MVVTEITIDTAEASKFFFAMQNPTRQRIVYLIAKNPKMNITRLASILNQSISTTVYNVKILQKAQIITGDYSPGKHGVKKELELNFNKVIIHFEIE